LRGFNGVSGFDFGIGFLGTISFTACTVVGNSFEGFRHVHIRFVL
jgi:hypothetical protein